MLLRQFILIALSALGIVLWIARTDGYVSGFPLWTAAMLVWVSQSMFWLGWFSRDLKLLVYLSGAWVGVMACVAVLGTFIGGGVAASGEQTAIRIAIAVVLLVPIALLPRFRALWPGAELPSGILPHLARSVFVILQYAGIGFLMISLNPLFTCVTTCP